VPIAVGVRAPPCGGVYAEQLGQLLVAAMSELERFEPGVQTPLSLIEQAVEQDDSGFELLG
jgi:hypothetical protein